MGFSWGTKDKPLVGVKLHEGFLHRWREGLLNVSSVKFSLYPQVLRAVRDEDHLFELFIIYAADFKLTSRTFDSVYSGFMKRMFRAYLLGVYPPEQVASVEYFYGRLLVGDRVSRTSSRAEARVYRFADSHQALQNVFLQQFSSQLTAENTESLLVDFLVPYLAA